VPEADTTDEARQVQLTTYRAMGPVARLLLAFELSEELRHVASAGRSARADAGR
jgi:hypothetical protein